MRWGASYLVTPQLKGWGWYFETFTKYGGKSVSHRYLSEGDGTKLQIKSLSIKWTKIEKGSLVMNIYRNYPWRS